MCGNVCFWEVFPQPLGDPAPRAGRGRAQRGCAQSGSLVTTPGRGLSLELRGPSPHAASPVMVTRKAGPNSDSMKPAWESGPFSAQFPRPGLLPVGLCVQRGRRRAGLRPPPAPPAWPPPSGRSRRGRRACPGGHGGGSVREHTVWCLRMRNWTGLAACVVKLGF